MAKQTAVLDSQEVADNVEKLIAWAASEGMDPVMILITCQMTQEYISEVSGIRPDFKSIRLLEGRPYHDA